MNQDKLRSGSASAQPSNEEPASSLPKMSRDRIRKLRQGSAKVPTDLARTSAFAPRRAGLKTQSFRRTYIVGDSIVEVEGRELGTQHRDALYALLKLEPRSVHMKAEEPGLPMMNFVLVQVTWREMLHALNLNEHKTNLRTVLNVFEQLRSVNIRVFAGGIETYRRSEEAGELPDGEGFSDNLLGKIHWQGKSLDSTLTVQYGDWLREVIRTDFVGLRPEYFSLKSDYAKTLLPFIESNPDKCTLGEAEIGELVDRDIRNESRQQLFKFRTYVDAAFKDMQRVGALASFQVEEVWEGRKKFMRYSWERSVRRAAPGEADGARRPQRRLRRSTRKEPDTGAVQAQLPL